MKTLILRNFVPIFGLDVSRDSLSPPAKINRAWICMFLVLLQRVPMRGSRIFEEGKWSNFFEFFKNFWGLSPVEVGAAGAEPRRAGVQLQKIWKIPKSISLTFWQFFSKKPKNHFGLLGNSRPDPLTGNFKILQLTSKTPTERDHWNDSTSRFTALRSRGHQ